MHNHTIISVLKLVKEKCDKCRELDDGQFGKVNSHDIRGSREVVSVDLVGVGFVSTYS